MKIKLLRLSLLSMLCVLFGGVAQAGDNDLLWDYTEAAPSANPDNGLYYGSSVNDASKKGIKMNGDGWAAFSKANVAGTLKLTIGLRKSDGAYAVDVYKCNNVGATASAGDLIGTVSVTESMGTNSIDIPADVTGIYIKRNTSSEGVLQKIEFKETKARTFVDFEMKLNKLSAEFDTSTLPAGVTFNGTFNSDDHGYRNATVVVPVDGTVKFSIGGCQYTNKTFNIKDAEGKIIVTLNPKTDKCYHQDGSVFTYLYIGAPTTLTFENIQYLPYFKAEATEVQEATITYKDQNGKKLGEKVVYEGDPVGEIPYTEADLTIPTGEKFRGWVYTNGIKVKATDIVNGNTTISALVTPIETVTVGSIQTYDLTKATFYAEDHEAFINDGGSFHDGQHGWSWGSGKSFSILVAGNAQIVLGLCVHSAENAITVTAANGTEVDDIATAKATSDGATATVNYTGAATTLTFTFAGTTYIHNIKVYNVESFPTKDEATNYYIIGAGDAAGLLLAMNTASSEAGSKIFLPNGTYDLGKATLTTISGSNVSLIGESMEGVIIKNRPEAESINATATLLNTGTGTYFQDLTLDCIAPWGGSAERGVCLQDKGNQTICKNVYLKGLQDSYYSNNNSGTYYFEDGKIEGSVDYVCGNGDVYFNKVLFYTVNKSTGNSGGCIAAPNTKKSFGYIFNECTLDGMANENDKYRLGRPWAAQTIVRMLDTKMLILPKAEGWDEWDNKDAAKQNAVEQFAEYNSVDANGNAVDLSARKKTFKNLATQPVANNPIITEAEAANYRPTAIFNGTWKPFEIAAQLDGAIAEYKDGAVKITPADDGAIAYLIEKNGEFVGITKEFTYPIEVDAEKDKLTIRSANARGGFGEAKQVSNTATSIKAINAAMERGEQVIYNLSGQRVNKATRGLYIINGRKVAIK